MTFTLRIKTDDAAGRTVAKRFRKLDERDVIQTRNDLRQMAPHGSSSEIQVKKTR
jgi:hypothetical protein